MDFNLLNILCSTIPSLVVGIAVGIFMKKFNSKQDAHYEEQKIRSELRKNEGMLSLKLQMANGKLSYACAMALKRGHANGEVEDAIESYEKTKEEYDDFINTQYINYIK